MKNPNDVNDLITSLVKSFNEFDKSLKNKIKVNSIFSSLDENISKNFNKLVNLSDIRYKSVKSGIKLKNIVNIQKHKYENLLGELENDKLYSTNILDTEKAKLFKNSFTVKNKEINDIRNKLKNSLKLKQHIYEYKMKKLPSKEKIPKLKGIIKKVANLAYVNDFLKNKLKQKKLEKQNEKLIGSLIEEDYKYFQDKIKTYQNYLNKIRDITENNKEKNLKLDKTIFKETIQSMNPNSFRALTYTETSSQKEKNIPKKDLEFNLKKIKNIKMSHDKNYNNILKNKNSKNENQFNFSTLTNISLKNNSNNLNNLKNNNLSKTINFHNTYDVVRNRKNKSFDSNKLKNFKNTAYIVLNEAENGLLNEQNFIKKRNKLNNNYKLFKNSNRLINTIHSLNETKIKLKKDADESHNHNQIDDYYEIKNYNYKNVDDIKRTFQEIYEEKKKRWEKEDIIRGIEKEKDKQNLVEIENFLFEIQDKSLFAKNKTKYIK